jgi:hypothetical protein
MATMIVEEAGREGVRALVVGDMLYTASNAKISLVCSFEARWWGALTKKNTCYTHANVKLIHPITRAQSTFVKFYRIELNIPRESYNSQCRLNISPVTIPLIP